MKLTPKVAEKAQTAPFIGVFDFRGANVAADQLRCAAVQAVVMGLKKKKGGGGGRPARCEACGGASVYGGRCCNITRHRPQYARRTPSRDRAPVPKRPEPASTQRDGPSTGR